MVDRISREINHSEFCDLYLSKNKPCIFSSSFTKKWRSRREWVKQGRPDFNYLTENFGNCSIPVANCSRKQFNSHEKTQMIFKEFLEYWKKAMENEETEKLFYLKDWHFQRDFPEYRSYEVLDYFQSDWLNEWYDQNDQCFDDYRFVYMGPKGTWTAFHADVLRSYSWSANICGKKKWLLYPPGEEENLKDWLGNLPFDVTSSDMQDVKKFPNYHKAVKPMEIVQEEGEVVFIPSCWHHQVYNLEDTISINHNWTNAYGILYMQQHLQSELALVEKEIGEFRHTDGWHQQCQLLLRCTAGLDYEQFAEMLIALMKPRFRLLKQQKQCAKDHISPTAFKRFDITCVPKEHLKFGTEESFGGVNDLRECIDISLGDKLRAIRFDLSKLIEAFRNFHPTLDTSLEGGTLQDHKELIHEIEKLLCAKENH